MVLRPVYKTQELSVIFLSINYGEEIEFMWVGSECWFGRMPGYKEDLALEISERINSEASSEEEAIAIFEEMS